MGIKDFETIYKRKKSIIKNKEKIVSELRKILGDENVSVEEVDILAYTRDATPITYNWTIEGKLACKPDIIVYPETVLQISEILKLANREKIPIIPYSKGSGVVGGAIAVYGGIIIDMKKFDKIIELNEQNLTVTVEAGINGMNLERFLNSKGYTTGHFPQSIYTSSVAGYIAHRAAGQLSTKYGKIEDIVLGMEVVLPDGEIVNFKTIPRASKGPILEKLFMGAEGTLGIVTKATLQIWPYPEERALISYAFPTFEDALNACRSIIKERIFPAVIRIYDKAESRRHFKQFKCAKKKLMTIFLCEGNSKLVKLEENIVKEMCERFSGYYCGEKPVEHWLEKRYNVTESSLFPTFKIIADTIEVACMWDKVSDLYNKVVENVKKIKGNLIISAHVSHFYPNGVGIYFTFSGLPPKDVDEFEYYKENWETIIKTVLELGGSIGHHHGIGINRAKWMPAEWGNAFNILKKIKKLFDPNNILNPGKLYESIWE
ncbi:MAG: FAD-binding oxidoreductase [Candidatus Helarchaeota archaeon]